MSLLPFRFPRIEPVQAIVLMFALTQGLALLAGLSLIDAAKSDANVQLINVAPTGNSADLLNALFFILYVLAGAAGALLAIRFFKSRLTFRLLEIAVLLGSVSVFFFAIAYRLLGQNFAMAGLVGGLLGALFSLSKFFFPSLKNGAAILSSAGVGALFGFSLSFWPAVLFVIAISLYDYVAVFRTRHMLVLAQNLGRKDLSFTITAQASPEEEKNGWIKVRSSNATHTYVRARSLPQTIGGQKPSSPSSPVPVSSSSVDRLDLGSGDLAIPAMLAVSSFSLAGLGGSVAAALGSIVSLYVLLHFVVEKRVVLPALPPICLGALLALFIRLLMPF